MLLRVPFAYEYTHKEQTVFHIFFLPYLFYVWYIHPLAYCVFLCSLSSNSIHPVDEEPHLKVSSQKGNLTICLYPSCTFSFNHNFNTPRSGFSPRPVHVGFIVNKVALVQVFPWYFVFPRQDNSTNTVLYNYSLVCHRHITALATDGVCK